MRNAQAQKKIKSTANSRERSMRAVCSAGVVRGACQSHSHTTAPSTPGGQAMSM